MRRYLYRIYFALNFIYLLHAYFQVILLRMLLCVEIIQSPLQHLNILYLSWHISVAHDLVPE